MDPEIANKYPMQSEPRIRFIAYLIFCSYLVSLTGAVTTVELLHRRVSGSGWRSWVQLAGCAVSFGGVAIWCMHFVGNRAIILGDGEAEIQLYYSATFTVVSFVLPVIVLFCGFIIADRFYKGNKNAATRFCSLLGCSICAGASIVEMHYIGNYGTSDFNLHLSWPHVAGAALIAVGASLLSFGLFFHWSGHWMNNIWRRLIVACFLALAVSGMHWTAAAGTRYEITGYHEGSEKERDVNLIIALSLSLSSCVVVFLLGFLKQRHRKMLKDRAQQFVLAAVMFDAEGRLLVNQSGLLPSQTITRQFHQRSFDDEFNTAHPVFQWIFRVSRNWSGIADLVPLMRDHLHAIGCLSTYSPVMGSGSRTSIGSENDTSYSATFRELVCVTASDIAKSLDTGLQNLGSLYEAVVTTGTLSSRTVFKDTHGNKAIIATDVVTSQEDVEAGIVNPILHGKGQMLVLTKKVDTSEANRLQNLGFRFANMEQVGDNLVHSLQIPRGDLEVLISRVYAYSQREAFIPTSGTYLASFLIQPSPGMKGLDVVVPKDTPDRLPMVKFTDRELSDRETKLLTSFNGRTLDDCLARTNQHSGMITEDQIFLEKFRNKILDLLRDSPEAELHRATFSSQKLTMMHGSNVPKEMSQATIYAFCGIKEIYIQSLQSHSLKTIPMTLFQTYLRSYPGCPDHAILVQKNHKEFSELLQTISSAKSSKSSKLPRTPGSRHSSRWAHRLQLPRSSSMEMIVRSEGASVKGLVQSSSETHGAHFWGGIMVTSEQNVIIDETKNDPTLNLCDMGVRTEAGIADSEQQTLADRLISITTSFRDPHASRAPPKDLHYGRR